MKKILTSALLWAALTGAALAQPHQATGVVKRVDEKKGVVSVAHEPIKSLGWSAMTMNFELRDRKALEALKPNQKISFEFVDEKGRYVITSVK